MRRGKLITPPWWALVVGGAASDSGRLSEDGGKHGRGGEEDRGGGERPRRRVRGKIVPPTRLVLEDVGRARLEPPSSSQ